MKSTKCIDCNAERENCPAKGSPGRCPACFASHKKARVAAYNREYKTKSGSYQKDLTCIDCGILREGAPLSGKRGRCPPCRDAFITKQQAECLAAWAKRPEVIERRKLQRLQRVPTDAQRARRYLRHRDYMASRFANGLLYWARYRAKKNGLPLDIEIADIVVPERCPVFGTLLEHRGGLANPNLATLDRIEPSLGYVKGNVWVISWKANRLKRDASVSDLRTLVAAIDNRVAA